MRFLKNHALALGIALVWSLALNPWDVHTMWASHSPGFEPLRSMAVLDAWKHGIHDARWLPLFDKGYGYPFFSYHAPLFSWVCAAFLALTSLPVLALKITIFVFFLTGGLGCRTLAAHYWGERGKPDPKSGDLAFLAWASVTYLLTNIFVRGSLAEFAASCFFPWVLYGMWLISWKADRYRDGILTLGVASALLTLCHNAIALYVALLMLFPLTICFQMRDWRGWASLAAGGLLAALLAAFFVIPVALEKDFVTLNKIVVEDTSSHFVRVDHLLALQQWNLGLSGQDDGAVMPRHQGLVLPLVLFGGCFALALARKIHDKLRVLVPLSLALVTLLLAMKPSSWLWEAVRALKYSQFPWRWLSLNAATLALLAPAPLHALRATGLLNRSHTTGWTLFLGVALLLNIALYGGPNHRWTTWSFDPAIEPLLFDKHRTALGDEYGPVWRDPEFNHYTQPRQLLLGDGRLLEPDTPWGKGWQWSLPPAREETLEARAGVHYFPGWKAFLSQEGKRHELEVTPERGLIHVQLPAGDGGVLELQFTNTPVRFWSKLISGLSWLVLLLALCLFRLRDCKTVSSA